ncbi:hypothetical protein C8R46DRAFT_1220631 [Mycena filopes]|nr:hypothetical protein C8R46DRAFT_1220631 [Mycena filopes]
MPPMLDRKASDRVRHAWDNLPDHLKPTGKAYCPHRMPRIHTVVMTKEGDEGNVTVFNPCKKPECPSYATVVTLNAEDRAEHLARMAVFDAAQAALKTPKRKTPVKKTSTSGKSKQPRASGSKGKGKAKDALTQDATTPPRKKARREPVNVSPPVAPEAEVSAEVAKNLTVVLYMQAGVEPVTATDMVPDVRSFKFTDHKIFSASNAAPSTDNHFKPTRYVRYSPHADEFKDEEGSRVFEKTNLSESGEIVIYRAVELKDFECPDLEKFKIEVQMLSHSGCARYPSFPSGPIAGPSKAAIPGSGNKKRSFEEMLEESDASGGEDWDAESLSEEE